MELREDLKVGDEITIEVLPTEGSYKATTIDGTDFIEKFSVESANKIVDNWKADGSKPVLCDVDHSSVETSKTQAAGWVTNIWVDESAKRLMGTLQVSESGAELLNGLEYRYVSPVLLFTEDNFPYYLDSIALTNTPRLQELRPVYNSKDNDDAEKATVENEPEEKPEEDLTTPEKEKIIMDINELKAILGLPEEAVEEDVRNSLKEIMEKVKAMAEEEARLEAERIQKEEAEKEAALAAEAEALVNECGIEDEEKKAAIANSYKANPELVKTVVNAMKKEPVKMVVNAAEAVKPELTENEKLAKEWASIPGGQARVDFLLKHKGFAGK